MPERGSSFRAGWLGAGVLLALALLAGRVTGLLRELQLAAVLGVSAEADVAVLLLTLPDLLVSLLLSGGLSASLVPSLRKLAAAQAAAQFQQVSVIVAMGFGILALAVALAPNGLVRLLAPGLTLIESSIPTLAFGAMSLAIPLTALAGVSSAYLNANERFFIAGCGTLIFNICILVSLTIGSLAGQALESLGVGIAAGAMLRWVSQLAVLPADAWRFVERGRQVNLRFLRSFVATASAASLLLLVPVLVRALASMVGPGAIASFNYATKLVEMPSGILVTAVSTVALSRLSALHGADDQVGARRVLIFDVQRSVLLAIAVVVPGFWSMDSVVSLMFGHGQMHGTALAHLTELTRIALVGMPCIAVASMATVNLNAQGHSATVLRIAFMSLVMLPLLCVPGLYFSSVALLMAATVAFQAVLAQWLGRVSGLRLLGPQGWMDRRMILLVGLVVVPGSLLILIDTIVGISNHTLRILFASAAFAISCWFAVSFLKRADDQIRL